MVQSWWMLTTSTSNQPTTVQIVLSQGLFATIDASDYEQVSQYKWTALKLPHTTYARRTWRTPDRVQHSIYLHRFLMGAEKGQQVDHIDRNGLNCVRSNMRVATPSQNQHNKGINKNNTSGIKGVSFNKRSGKWIAVIGLDWKQFFLGYYSTKEEASIAYEAAARLLHKGFSNPAKRELLSGGLQ